ncbi:MAG: cytidylate kinase-like family protein [Candidatus Faecousia sp.]|nr:cytidylate kinase-like family protein [Clostridiales bacterium]MDD5884062.1 cytidylate kinase-like family protein [Bacillota bacterium]MDY4599243.1 cytidylate kinase-like family protein [Candidatus Faecousia sp.]
MKRIITIGREFGAGGSDLGRRLARELGIAYYDRDIILRTAKASAHLTPEQVRQWDERVPREFGFTQSLFNFYSRPLSEELWEAQVKAIRELANKESCVIVGRNADYILKEYDHCLRVFVHADRSWRLLRIRKEMPDVPLSVLESDMDTADRARRAYCEKMTGRTYGDSRNYDLTLCISSLGFEKAYQLLKEAAEIV